MNTGRSCGHEENAEIRLRDSTPGQAAALLQKNDQDVAAALFRGSSVEAAQGDVVTMVRNHELIGDSGAFGASSMQYDPAATGGTTTLRFQR